MTRSLVIVIVASLVALSGCSLVFDAADHMGGSADGGDSGARAAGVPPDGSAPDAGSDAGIDGGPPLPTECASSDECGAVGSVACVEGRCRFCAPPAEDVRTLRSGPGVRPQLALGFGSRLAGPPFVHVASFGATSSTESEWYRFEHGGPTVDTRSIGSAITITCPYDRLLGGSFQQAGAGSTVLGLLGDEAAGTHWMFVGWSEGSEPGSTVYDCRGVLAPESMLGPLVPIPASSGIFAARLLRPAGTGLVSVEAGYGNEQDRIDAFQATTEDVSHLAHAHDLLAVSTADRSQVRIWRYGSSASYPSTVLTTGRTTDPDLASTGPDDALLVFGIADRIRLVPVHCDGSGYCDPMGETHDVRTEGEAEVRLVRIVRTGTTPLLLSVERRPAGTDQLVLRALRPSYLPWDGPNGGRALIVETAAAGEQILDAQLATTGSGPIARHALAWLTQDGAGDATIRAWDLGGACEP